MNAAEHERNIEFAHAIASVANLVRHYFPEASVNLMPWRDDPETRRWDEAESLDIAFHFPGWSPSLQCRSLLIQLRISNEENDRKPHLLGVIMRGITFEGERWRLVTVGDWSPAGNYLPKAGELRRLHSICRELFSLFSVSSL